MPGPSSGKTRLRPDERPNLAAAFVTSLIEDLISNGAEAGRRRAPGSRGGAGIPVINRAPAGQIIDCEEYCIDSNHGFEYIDFGDINDHLATFRGL